MLTDISLVLAIVLATIVLFSLERIPLEVTSLAVVCLLGVTGVLTPAEAFAGFSNETVIFIFALLAMTEGLASAGVMHRAGSWLSHLGRLGPRGFLLGVMLLVAAFSSVVSNTVTTAAFLPVVLRAAKAARLRRSWVLMPLAFASMLGGMGFLYGTSTNLVVSARLDDLGLGPIGLVELTPAGVPIALLGIALVVLLAPRVLPARTGAETEGARGRHFVTEVLVPEGSRLIGKGLVWLERRVGLEVVSLTRAGARGAPGPDVRLAAGDRLLLGGRRRDILRPGQLRGLVTAHDLESPTARRGTESVLAEAIVQPTSGVSGVRVGDVGFSRRLGVRLLALHRHPSIQRPLQSRELGSLRSVRLEPGDALLLCGPRERLHALMDEPSLLLMPDLDFLPLPRRSRALLASLIFVTALVVGSTGVVSLSLAGVAGVLLMVLTGCLDAKLVFRIDWRVVLLIGSMMALGLAMEKSGAGQLLGGFASGLAEVGGPRLVLLCLMLLTVVLSIPMSNQAAALVVLPVGISAAAGLGVDPRSFAMGIALAASCSFLTPLEPSCMLVFGPGRYRFSDFLRLGGPLTALMLATLVVLVPWVWPMDAHPAAVPLGQPSRNARYTGP
ncbi:SLC13 family permease [Pyxidicoccus xibeiensis]|uniref:SLC13 family permease n=1 Tax=Pyxidicoccus xibeiensis TaxID=2906759 RepID=UPI0020A813C2|nr:SLC13 family permease [Pyxidicoccus xibeiensis]MCP3143814.1 SLC13 family permease [Pyxidicoccus xibeiensis]